MPIFEYVCTDCKKRFEALLYGSQKPQCPLCKGANLEQQISVFSVGSGTRSAPAACTPAECPAAGTPCCGGACSH
jgi:putative FmdB family regulatory protein